MQLPLSQDDIQAISTLLPHCVLLNVNLATYSRWRIGGLAKCIVQPTSECELRSCLALCRDRNLKYIVLGATSNVLFSDQGLNIVAISLTHFKHCHINNESVSVGAGIWVPSFARILANAGLAGLEHIVGIPGRLGGLVYMNGGSQRKGIGEHILRVTALTVAGYIRYYHHDECDFSYRHSAFQNKNEIITEVNLVLHAAPAHTIRAEMLSILRSRRHKFPLRLPNCGSVFVSNPAMYKEFGPPGAVIEGCNLKGVNVGGAQVSNEHANFIVNTGGASAKDVVELIKKVQVTAYQATGYNMVSEVRYLSSDGVITPAADVVLP